MHVSHNAPCSPYPTPPLPTKNLENFCFSFLLSITAVPRETEENDCAKINVGEGSKQGVLWETSQWRIDLKMIFILIQLRRRRIVLYTLQVRDFGTRKWHITLNPKPPCGLIFFSTTFEGGGGGGLFNLAKRINGSKVSWGRTCGSWALHFFY